MDKMQFIFVQKTGRSELVMPYSIIVSEFGLFPPKKTSIWTVTAVCIDYWNYLQNAPEETYLKLALNENLFC